MAACIEVRPARAPPPPRLPVAGERRRLAEAGGRRPRTGCVGRANAPAVGSAAVGAGARACLPRLTEHAWPR